MSSYQLSQTVNAQSILWAISGAIYSAAVAVHTAYQFIIALLPTLLILCKALALVAVIVGIAAVVAMIPPTFWLGLVITGAFGWVTFPCSKKVSR